MAKNRGPKRNQIKGAPAELKIGQRLICDLSPEQAKQSYVPCIIWGAWLNKAGQCIGYHLIPTNVKTSTDNVPSRLIDNSLTGARAPYRLMLSQTFTLSVRDVDTKKGPVDTLPKSLIPDLIRLRAMSLPTSEYIDLLQNIHTDAKYYKGITLPTPPAGMSGTHPHVPDNDNFQHAGLTRIIPPHLELDQDNINAIANWGYQQQMLWEQNKADAPQLPKLGTWPHWQDITAGQETVKCRVAQDVHNNTLHTHTTDQPSVAAGRFAQKYGNFGL